jgi:WD40 repeat protein
MHLRDARIGPCLIATLIAVGVCYAKWPEFVNSSLSQMHLGAAFEQPNSSQYVRKLSWSSDSRKLLTVAHGEVGLDGSLVVHDLDDPPHRLPIDVTGEWVTTAALSPDGRHVLVATLTGKLWWIALESDQRTTLLELPRARGFSAAALSADGRHVAAATTDGFVYLCDPARGATTLLSSGLQCRSSDMRFSEDGRWLLSAGQNGWLSVWEVQTGKLHQSWKGHDQAAMAAGFLPDDQILSASLDDSVRIWNRASSQEIWRGEFGLGRVHALALSADGKTAAWGGGQSRVIVWDLEKSRKKYEIQVTASTVWDVQFSPDNRHLAVAGSEARVHLYDAQTGAESQGLQVGQNL